MATTFSSNIGSSSKGGFSAYAVTTDDFVVAFFADMVTGEVTNAADGEEVYATTLTANQLAALSTNLKGLLAAAVASGADPTDNPLAYLRKLVGFVALDDGQTLTYDTSNIDGDVYEFYVEMTNQPGTVLMYIPNSAAAGLYTGSGSDEASAPPPVIPTTQRADAVANVPGLPLAGAVCMAVPNAVGAPTLEIPGITIDLLAAKENGSNFGVTAVLQDGYAPGQLAGILIEGNGIVTARYSNGQSKPAGQIELANFRSVQGLQPLGGNAWARTFGSGDPVLGVPGQGNFGSLQSGALEDSNTDITLELVNMITAQRVYQANAQTIRTQDQVLQTIVNLR
jgi:flagellar hook protein FlgE